jgi:hypothetical protein
MMFRRRVAHAFFARNVGFACVALAVGWTVFRSSAAGTAATRDTRHRPVEVASAGYVSSRQCRTCHAAQYASWHTSYHRTMTQVATPDSVRAPADGKALKRWDRTYALQRRGDEFWVRRSGEDAADEDRRIALVTGSHAMQVYWYESGEGRQLSVLPFAYMIDEARFIPREAAFMRPPDLGRPSDDGRWNVSCIGCHTTHGQPRVDAKGGLDSHVGEMGIACEACHGPGADHVARNAEPFRRYAGRFDGRPDTSIVDPRTLSHRRVSEMCGQCHGIWQFRSDQAYRNWMRDGFAFRPGDDPRTTRVLFQPSLRTQEPVVDSIMQSMPSYTAGSFWPDGMSRVSGREFNAMFSAPCYERGEMSCLSCHEMHQQPDDSRAPSVWADDQLGVGMDGNRACLQCHTSYASALQRHTGHAPGSSGSLCYNCHMPHTTFGLLKAIRSHQVSSPDLRTSLATGRPNACNLCHLDKTLAWTAEQLQRRHGSPQPVLSDAQQTLAAAVLGCLTGDAGERALYAWAMAWPPARKASDGAGMLPLLGVLLDDPYAAVRHVAGRSLRSFPAFAHFDYDDVAAPDPRAPTAPRVWRLLERGKGVARPELLLTAAGTFDAPTAARIGERRDDRPVHLLE